MALAEPLMVWVASFQAFSAVGLAQALQIDRRLGREQLQHLALERGIAEREARQIGAIDGIHCQLVGRVVEVGRCFGVRGFACQARFSPTDSRDSRVRRQGLAAAALELPAEQY